jgi:hypothetical protein
VVIVLRPVEHDGAALEGVRGLRVRQVAVAELFEITLVFMIALSNRLPLQHEEAGVLLQRLVEGRITSGS